MHRRGVDFVGVDLRLCHLLALLDVLECHLAPP